MTGKHVQPVVEGQAQPKRSGLAIGLTILTTLLCIAVLFLSARRHRDQVVRSMIEERLVDLDSYRALGESIRLNKHSEISLDEARPVGPVMLRPPTDAWQLGESVLQLGDTRLRIGGISNARLRAEYLHPVDQPWSLGLLEAIKANPFLNAPARHDDRALLDFLFGSGAEVVREHIARPRQPVEIAQAAFETLRIRSDSRQLGHGRWRAPHPFSLAGLNGYVEWATEFQPVVSVLILRNNSVFAEALVTSVDGRVDEKSITHLNENWWSMIVGIEGPVSDEGPGE